MESPKKKSRIAKIIKEDKATQYRGFDFFSFDEKKLLEEKIAKLEHELNHKNQQLQGLKHNFEKKQAQDEVNFHDLLEKKQSENYDKGFADGQRQGFTEGENSVLKVNEYLKNCAESVLAEKQEIMFAQEEVLLKLVKKITEKVINTKLSEDDSVILKTIKKALSLISEKTILKIRISGQDLAVVEKNLENIKALYVDIKEVNLQIDDRVSRGGVIIETAGGNIDARFETQLEEIYESLVSRVREE